MPTSETNKKNKLLRSYTCSVCDTIYTTSRYSKTHYCSPDCRSKARSIRTANKRIEKIPASDAWLWVARECKRAGTVEILQDVDLEKLFAIYNRRYQCFGWDSEKKSSKFHICHIAPVSGDSSIGLLHHENLFIGSSLANQVHGVEHYADAGLCIAKSSLKTKWLINQEDSNKIILGKVKQYLGKKLYTFAKTNPIKKSHRFVLAERIVKLPNNTVALADLQRMGTQELVKLEAQLKEKEVFSLKLTAARSLVVYHEELERFASFSKGKRKENFEFVSAAVRVVAQWLGQKPTEHGLSSIIASSFSWYYEFRPLSLKPNKDSAKLRDYTNFLAFSTLQGAEVDRNHVINTLRGYLRIETLRVVEHGAFKADKSILDFDYIQEEHDLFRENVEKVKEALSVIGLLDPQTLQTVHENDKEKDFIARFHQDLRYANFYKYPENYYQAEPKFSMPATHTVDHLILPF
ncbi:hypothetical protein [Pseudomonas sp. PDM20]|uniref:hypothetical protein n=1 Tax=Pseudomonas sp. PDM20 TaxID=2769254 RepID=UPI001786F727|nr:hypothetical protein [Pseudomonas sp. PDM20]MBD9681439.1 hypothetical protein [Pseudomonas sp. PDM20]